MDAIIEIGQGALFVAAIILLVLFEWQKQKERHRRRALKGALGDGDIQTLFKSPDKKN